MTLLSQDEGRFAEVPTLTPALALRGARPCIGTRDGRGLVHVYAAADVVTGRLVTRLAATTQWERRKAHQKGCSRQRRLQHLFAQHLEDIARAYPAARCPRVELVIDNAPWHRGAAITAALARHPHLHLLRLPSYAPQLQPIEWLWKRVRRDTTHNTLFPDLAHLYAALRRTLRRLRRNARRVLQALGDCWHTPISAGR